ncbi:MFS transporter [Belnapia sp. F-4-1]|uniref:MFS transporter n=1 Tax=Belnapia sp. F-4-1 TaxID=1545443 RepID=UPI0005B8D425|nr:MFS transporter [Belnapia sp. F-4-1]
MTPQDGLPQPRRSLAAIAILLSILVTVLDTSMINVALPAIAHDLGVAPASVIWLSNGYQLVVVATLISFASLAEIIGFRRVYLGGFVLYVCASLACALAPSFPALVAARVVQGIGASAVMALTAGLIRYTYPGNQLGRAIGFNTLTVALAGAIGPTLGSTILALGPWPWLFAVGVPLGLAATILGGLTLPETPRAHRRFDAVAAGLAALAFGLLFLGIDLCFALPWAGAVLMAGGIAAGITLIRRDLTRPAPLLPLDLLRLPPVAISALASVCAFAAWSLGFVSLPFHFIANGHDQATTGFMMTPWPVALAVAAPLAGRLSDRLPTALLCMLGGSTLAVALGLVIALPGAAPVVLLGLAVGLGGFGFGFFQTPNNRTMLSAAPKARSGGAGGMQATARLLGQTIGTTMTALIFQAGGGPKLAMAAGAGFALAAAGISMLRRKI